MRWSWNQHQNTTNHEDDYAQFGGIKYRRREEPILTQQVMNDRCSSANTSSVLDLHDNRNAFPSIKNELLNEMFDSDDPPTRILKNHINSHVTKIVTSERDLYLKPQEGVPQGSSPSTNIFNKAYNISLTEHRANTAKLCKYAIAQSPVSQTMINCSHTSFVDDLAGRCAASQPLHLPHARSLVVESVECSLTNAKR